MQERNHGDLEKKIHVYVAGPLFTSGRFTDNIRRAYEAAETLREGGTVPFIPHLHSFLDIHSPREEDYWLELDKDWLLRSDALFRLEGYSRGADLEEQWAKEAGIPIYYEVSQGLQQLIIDAKEKLLKPRFKRVQRRVVKKSDIVTSSIPDDNPDTSYLSADRLAAYKKGEFSFIGIQASVQPEGSNHRIYSGGLWGIEDDSSLDYIRSVEAEEIDNLIYDLKRDPYVEFIDE